MFDDSDLYKRLAFAVCAALAFTAPACGSDTPEPGGDDQPPPPPDAAPPPPPPPVVFAKRASRASTIAISEDDARVAMVNPDDNSISVFSTVDNSRISKPAVGPNPSSVVIAGDGKTAYVANRNDGTVSRVINIDGSSATADAKVDVGSEPVGLALSPSGRKLFVAEFAESRVAIVDTQTMAVIGSVNVDRPRALVVTNNADENDDDERLLVSQFFGVPVPGKEVKDDGRVGRILSFSLTDVSDDGGTIIDLAPTAGINGVALTSANQLGAMAVNGNRVYITSVSASPQGPTKFDGNVYPVVYVADLTTGTEVRDATGTANLAAGVIALLPIPPAPAPPPVRFIPGDLSDIAFIDGGQFGYVVSRAGDLMLRLEYGATLKIGAPQNNQIDLLPSPAPNGVCQNPTGVVASKTLARGYVNCWVNRRLAVVDFASQKLSATVEASPAPADPSIEKGKRFYFTGRARWSEGKLNGARGGEGWSSCGSCHPDGLTDNITWAFGTGPRQTTSMDGSFSHGPGVGPQKQRMFNWTAVNDEMHDFEANVRGVSGGVGAITSGDCASLATETLVVFHGPLTASNKELADAQVGSCKRVDWDEINNFVKTISPPHASRIRDAQAIANGRAVFSQGRCDKCHGGAGWTISRRPYNPVGDGAIAFGAPTFTQSLFGDLFVYDQLPRAQISVQPPIAADTTGPATGEVGGVLQLACALRNVGTYGIPGDDTATTLFEVRGGGITAQGRAGYNIPSLYGLALGAPYLHHGQSPSLDDLFSNSKWLFHTRAGNAIFQPSQTERANLIKFLLSIDAATTEFSIPSEDRVSFDLCPGTPGQSPGT